MSLYDLSAWVLINSTMSCQSNIVKIINNFLFKSTYFGKKIKSCKVQCVCILHTHLQFITCDNIKHIDGLGWVCVKYPFSLPSSLHLFLLSVRFCQRELVSEISAQTHQQQDVHSEQIEAEQQRGTLAGAEGHSEHPHQTRATSSSSSDSSFRRLDENSSL